MHNGIIEQNLQDMDDIIGVTGTKKLFIRAIIYDLTLWRLLLHCKDCSVYEWCQIIAWHGGEALLGAGNGEQIFNNSGHVAIFVDDISNQRCRRVVCLDIKLGHFGRCPHNTEGGAQFVTGIGDKTALLFVCPGSGSNEIA